MKSETAQIHFLSDVYPQILLPWQPDVTTSPLCAGLTYCSEATLY